MTQNGTTPACVCVRLVVDGDAKGKGRPKFVRATGRAYTPAPTLKAEARIQQEWIAAGRPRLDDGPLAVRVAFVIERPQGHWKKDGSLSAAGLRKPWPTRKPDLDNAVKLVMDSLNGMAYRDDVDVVHLATFKRWADAYEHGHTAIEIRPFPNGGFGV